VGDFPRTFTTTYDRDGGPGGAPELVTQTAEGRQVITVLSDEGGPECDEPPCEYGLAESVGVPDLVPTVFDRTYHDDPDHGLKSVTRTQTFGDDERSLTVTYDTHGRPESVEDGAGRWVRYEYDARGFPVRQYLPGVVVDGEEVARRIDYAYDDNGSLLSVTRPRLLGEQGEPDGDEMPHAFGYDVLDRMEDYDPPELGPGSPTPVDRTFGYDADGRLTSIDFVGPSRVDFEYERQDAQGEVHATVELRKMVLTSGEQDTQQVGFSYELGKDRLQSVNRSDGADLGYGYDGPLLSTVAFTDSQGLPLGTVEHGYLERGFDLRRVGVTGAGAATWTPDRDGLLQTVDFDVTQDQATDWALQVSREHGAGLVTGTELGRVVTMLEYNDFGELEDYTAALDGEVVYEYHLERDAGGRIVRKTEWVTGCDGVMPPPEDVVLFEFDYDAAGRLREVRRDGVAAESYQYGANGNRLEHGANVLDQVTLADYEYDDRGDLVARPRGGGSLTLDYDALGSLTEAGLPGGGVRQYVLDGLERRVMVKDGGGNVRRAFLYQDPLNPVAELAPVAGGGGGGVLRVFRQYVYATRANVPDAVVQYAYTEQGAVDEQATTVWRVVSDHLGSPRLVLPVAAGQGDRPVQCTSYTAFGEVTLDETDADQDDPPLPPAVFVDPLPFGFAGGLYDRDTGLVHFGAREYDPADGRWTSKDPILFGGGDTNLYGYVLADPMNLVDPAGLCPGEALADALWLEPEEQEIKDRASGAGAAMGLGLYSIALCPQLAAAAAGAATWLQRLLARAQVWAASGGRVASKAADKFRRTPRNLAEKLSMDEAKGGAGRKIMDGLSDPKYGGMEKWQHVHRHPDGTNTVIHYVRNPATGKLTDFKLK